MASVNVTIRMDDSQKHQLECIFADMGMNMSTGFNIYAREVLKSHRIPFEIRSIDPFYSASNMKRLRESVKQLDEGKAHEHELVEVDDEENLD